MLARSAFKSRLSRSRTQKRPDEKHAPAFLQWLRGRPCAVEASYHGTMCEGRIEAAHVDHGGDKGMGTKAADRFAIPLCSKHHAEQHRIGWPAFEEACNIVALKSADGYWRAWPGLNAWLKKLAGEA